MPPVLLWLDPLFESPLVAVAPEVDEVPEGPLVIVDAGDELFMQELSSEEPTFKRSDDPPLCPCPSVSVNMRRVPALTLAFHRYEVCPAGT